MSVSGSLVLPGHEQTNIAAEDLVWDKASFSIGISDMRGIQEEIEVLFDEQTYAFLTAVSENSVFEVADREDRVLRKTATFELETYMPSRKYMIQSNGDVREMNYEVDIENGESASETLIMNPLPTEPVPKV